MGRAAAACAACIIAALLFVPPAGARPAAGEGGGDRGFPVDRYLRDLVQGQVFLGGKPPVVVGAKTKNAEFFKEGKAHYVAQVALRRAGRDSGDGTFVVLQSRTWGSAIAYVVSLDRGITDVLATAFPKSIFRTKFKPLKARIAYTFELAPRGSEDFEQVNVASTPHPDPKLAANKVALVTLKGGLLPGRYTLRLKASLGLEPHPLRTLYEAYEQITGVVEWASLVAKPFEVVLDEVAEKIVDKTIDEIVAQGAAAATATATLVNTATKEKIGKKALEEAVKRAFTETEARYELTIPALVPELKGKSAKQVLASLEERGLVHVSKRKATTDKKLLGPGGTARVAEVSPKPGTKVQPGSKITVTYWVRKGQSGPSSGGETTPRAPDKGREPTAATCPPAFKLEVLHSLPPNEKVGEFELTAPTITRTYPESPYYFKCLYLHAQDMGEAFVIFFDLAPPNVPGVIASGDCVRRSDNPLLSEKRYVSVSGGERRAFTQAAGGNLQVLLAALRLAESQGVGQVC